MSAQAKESREAWAEKVAVLIYDAHMEPNEAEAQASSMMSPSPWRTSEESAPAPAPKENQKPTHSKKGPGKGGDAYRASREELQKMGF